MNFRALAEFVMMTAVAMSILTVSVGFTTRVFLTPIIKDFLGRKVARADGTSVSGLERSLERIEERLDALDAGLERVAAAQDFDRRLGPRLEEERKTP